VRTDGLGTTLTELLQAAIPRRVDPPMDCVLQAKKVLAGGSTVRSE